MSVLDIASGSITGTVEVGNDPQWHRGGFRRLTLSYVANVRDGIGLRDRRRIPHGLRDDQGRQYPRQNGGRIPASHLLYVSIREKAQSSPIVDPAKAAVIGTIAVGAESRRCCNRSADCVPLSSPTHDDNSVSVIDLERRTVVKTIEVGRNPIAATVDSDAHTIFVTNAGGASVSVIDSADSALSPTPSRSAMARRPSPRIRLRTPPGSSTSKTIRSRSSNASRPQR